MKREHGRKPNERPKAGTSLAFARARVSVLEIENQRLREENQRLKGGIEEKVAKRGRGRPKGSGKLLTEKPEYKKPRGVILVAGKYRAYTYQDGRYKHIGVYATEAEAERARDAYARAHGLK